MPLYAKLQKKRLPRVSLPLVAMMCFLLQEGYGSNVPAQPVSEVTGNRDIIELKIAILTDIANIVASDNELSEDVKSDINKMAITPLRESARILIAGADKQTRPVAVSFQKAFEQTVLKMIDEDQVSQVTAIIHTRKPTTPLCNPEGEALPQTMHPDMSCDLVSCKTIKDRTVTLREMARKKSLDLYVAYLKDGLEKRSPEEQKIYWQELNKPVNTSLHDTPLNCSSMPDEIVGASYVLKTRRGNELYFANNGKQAIDASGETHWHYWFGNLKESPVSERYRAVADYLNSCGLGILHQTAGQK